CDIAAGPWGIRTAAQPRDGAVDTADTFFQTGIDIGNCLTIGVVEVHRQVLRVHQPGYGLDQPGCLVGSPYANGVSQGYFVAPHGNEGGGQLCDPRGIDGPLVGAA